MDKKSNVALKKRAFNEFFKHNGAKNFLTNRVTGAQLVLQHEQNL